jgi:hypothetical protein
VALKKHFRQAAGQGGCRKAAVLSRCDRCPHRLHLLLHQPVDFAQGLLVDGAPDKLIGTGGDEGP